MEVGCDARGAGHVGAKAAFAGPVLRPHVEKQVNKTLTKGPS
jgi:hypothetical protein